MDEFLAIIKIFAGTFNPRGWQFCAGQLLSISQNTALFSLIGTTYGGDGRTTFALPDLRGRIPVGAGNGPGINPVQLGEVGGTNATSLTIQNLPAHNHAVTGTVQLPVSDSAANTNTPVETFLAQTAANQYQTASGLDFAGNLKVNLQTGVAGGSQPFSITSPYLGLNYIICMEGIFPSRD
jgi:microcystin-dependent protein